MQLAKETCAAYQTGDRPLSWEEAGQLCREIPKWALTEKAVDRLFSFKEFPAAMTFVNKVAEIAQQQDHHPDMAISYNKVHLTLTTHKIGGLSRNDFIVAAKVDLLEGTA